MLEQGALLVRPCAAFPAGAAGGDALALTPGLTVHDALSGAALGVAGWRGRRWPRWLRRPVLAVHEADDAPLLFTAHRRWGLAPHWEVRDADGGTVGLLYGPLLKDRFGRNLAAEERPPGVVRRVRDLEGRELMTLMGTLEGTRVAFGEAADGNPFLKMLLLAKALLG